MRRHIINTLFWMILGALAYSCAKDTEENTYSKQESNIETFIANQLSANDSCRVVYGENSTRLVVTEGSGDPLNEDGTVSFYYAGYLLTGTSVSSSNLFATNDTLTAQSAGWNISDTTAFRIKTIYMAETPLLDGLREGLTGVRGGEECYILFSGKYGYGKKRSGTIPAYSALAYHIWVESLSNE